MTVLKHPCYWYKYANPHRPVSPERARLDMLDKIATHRMLVIEEEWFLKEAVTDQCYRVSFNIEGKAQLIPWEGP